MNFLYGEPRIISWLDFYPAIFHTAEEGSFWISFPVLPECLTEGDTMKEAYTMAIEALGLSLTDRLHNQKELPQPSAPDQISMKSSDSHLVIIQFDPVHPHQHELTSLLSLAPG